MIHYYFNYVIANCICSFYFYQIGYLILGLLMKHRKNDTESPQASPICGYYFCQK